MDQHSKADFRALREAIGLTQQNLADHFGVSMDYLAGRTDRRDVWK